MTTSGPGGGRGNEDFEASPLGVIARIRAPFNVDQIESLNAYQMSGAGHPFTCGSESCPWLPVRKQYLLATRQGWRCPSADCGYTQAWAHAFMADWSWRDRLTALARLYAGRRAR